MATIKTAIKYLKDLEEKHGEDTKIAMVIFSKEDIEFIFENRKYDKAQLPEIEEMCDNNDWFRTLQDSLSVEGMQILDDLIAPNVKYDDDDYGSDDYDDEDYGSDDYDEDDYSIYSFTIIRRETNNENQS